MTQYPEPVLAAELNMGFASLAYVTDSDTGHDGSEPVTAEAVFARLKNAQRDILAVLEATVAAVGGDYVPTRAMDPAAVNRIMALPPQMPAAGRP
jgi:5'-methylthioadenosine phosphorylase